MPTLIAAMQTLDYHLAGLAQGGDLPTQLRNRRTNRTLSVHQAARLANLSPTTVLAIERGQGSVRSGLSLLGAIAPKARHYEPPRASWAPDPSGERDHQFTPPDFLSSIYAAFGEVDVDPCGHELSPVTARRRIMLSDGGDGLKEDWLGDLVFMNPPFSFMLKWLRRADQQWTAGNAKTIVALVPARTDSNWFHDHLRSQAAVYMMRGRLRFLTEKRVGNQAPFSLMVVVWGSNEQQRDTFSQHISGFWL
jgi:transcriptional regulator with XRE-family HTH domain